MIGPGFAGDDVAIIWSRRRAAGSGRIVRRFTLGEEHDATGHVALTLLNRKVTAQVEVNCS